MFAYFNEFYMHFLQYGFLFDAVVAFSVAFVVLATMVVIGAIIDVIETFFIRVLTRFFGFGVASFFCNRLTFIGVFVHELSHAFFINLLGGKVNKIRLFEFSKNGRLGHVEFQTQGTKRSQYCQLAFGSSAPVLIGMSIVYILTRLLLTYTFSTAVTYVLWYINISVACHMSMSRQDLKNYFRGMRFVFPVVWALCMLIQYFVFKK